MITLASQNDLNDLLISTNLQDIENGIVNTNGVSNGSINVTINETIKTSLPTLNNRNVQTKLPGGNFSGNNTNSSVGTSSSLFGVSPRVIHRDGSTSGILNAPTTTQSHSLMRSVIANSNRHERFPNIGQPQQQAPSTTSNENNNNIRWKRGEMLGQGAFGVVYLGLNIETGELMAVKQMAAEEVSRRELGALENEINLLRNMRHPNIVRYIGTEVTASSLSIFLEYVPGGSLKVLMLFFFMQNQCLLCWKVESH